jgi:thioredoxin
LKTRKKNHHDNKQNHKKKTNMEVKITSENLETYKNGDLPLVVDLWAPWCGPCKMLGPVISELAEAYDGRIVVGKCDIEENDDVAIDFGVRNIPTILFFKGGKLVDKFVGAAPKNVLDEKFKALL